MRTGRIGAAADAVLVGGVLAVVVGSFLPWVRSGRTVRDGYATGGAARRLLDVDEVAGFALRLVPFAVLACAVAVAAVLLGHGADRPVLRVIGRSIAVVIAGGTAVGALVTLTAHPGFGVTVSSIGPVVTIVGAAAVWVAMIISIGLFLFLR